jgi:uncharacterized DUF497 family protein
MEDRPPSVVAPPLRLSELFGKGPRIAPDPKHSQREDRFIAVGRSGKGRLMFVAFTVREKEGERLVRQVSARYMHKKESERYEEAEGS